MPVIPPSPGVNIEEVPSGPRVITGVATSITAFVGTALRGPVDEPIRCVRWSDFERTCGGLWAGSDLGYSVYQFFLNGGAQAIISRVPAGATAATLSIPGTGGGNLQLVAASPGVWGTNLRVSIDHGTAGGVGEITDTNTFHLTVDEIDSAVEAVYGYDRSVLARETFNEVSTDPLAPGFVTTVLRQRSALLRVTGLPNGRPAITTRQAATPSVDSQSTAATEAEYAAAITRLDGADLVNLLCIPPTDRNTPTTLGTWVSALSWCERQRAVLLVDPPDAWRDARDAADLAGGYDRLRSPNSAFYFPRIMCPDLLQQSISRPFAPSGAIAGVIARTDAQRGVWKAPAGSEATLAGVTRLEFDITEADTGVLNPRGVNAIRDLPAVGPVLWGARTGRGDDGMSDDWKYLPIRRFALYLEASLSRGLRWAVFEPNDEPLWAQIRLSVGTFMRDLFGQGAFQGTTPRDAFLVRCDATTTTPADIDAGIVNVVVGFAPLKPAEFVVLELRQLAGQVLP